jgi:transposase-like protein
MPKVASNKSAIIAKVPLACADEKAAVEFMEAARGWDTSPGCPRCGDTNVYQMMNREGGRQADFRWRCRGCKQQFTVRTGTIYEDSRIPLMHWCRAFYRAASSKKGVSALQIQRETGLSYKSALFLMHRIRVAMTEPPDGPLKGIVEADETYIGGKPRYSATWAPKDRRKAPGRGKYKKGPAPDFVDRKFPVVAAVERGGRVRAVVPENVQGVNLERVLVENVDPSAHLMTDERPAYKSIGLNFRRHDVVNHKRKEYVRGMVYTNSIEGFFSLIKRGVMGTYHHVSRKHLPKYVAEFEFRHNHRHIEDGERTVAAIQGAEGKRLLPSA